MDIVFCLETLNAAKDFFKHIKTEEFDNLWQTTVELVGEPEIRRRGRPLQNPDGTTMSEKQSYQNLYVNILQTLEKDFDDRFKSLEDLKFVGLVCTEKFESFCSPAHFPNLELNSLLNFYPNMFDADKLRNELSVVYGLESLRAKSLASLHKYLYQDQGLKNAFSETLKLCGLVSCIPCTSVTGERSFSTMRRIKSFLRNTMSQSRFSDLAMLTIEKDLLLNLQKQPDFYEKVISEFLKKDRRMEFRFK